MALRRCAILALLMAEVPCWAATSNLAFTLTHKCSGKGLIVKHFSLDTCTQRKRASLSVKADLTTSRTSEPAEPITLPTGAKLAPNLAIGSDGHIIAVEPIKLRGTCLLSAPVSNALVEHIGEGGLAVARQRLAMRLINLRIGGQDLGIPGLGMLPQRVDLPRCWSDEEISELQWTPLEAAARADKVFMEQSWSRVAPAGVSLGQFLDAESVVRRHARQDSEDPSKLVLLPEVCLLRRDAPRGGSLKISQETGEVQLVSGSMSRDTWGASLSSGWVTNDELLLNEGWAESKLESDSVKMKMDWLWEAAEGALSPEAEVRQMQQKVLQSMERYQYLKLSEDEVFVGRPEESQNWEKSRGLTILQGGYASDELGMVLQVLALTKEEFDSYGVAGCAMNIGETVPLSVDHEQRVGMLLLRASESLLSSFPTDIATDEALLEQPDISDRLRLCLLSRLSRKRCLKSCVDVARAWIERPTATGTLRRPWRVNIKGLQL